ncbi:uncharacterized protein [Epargyreus clarus]|uniref:uncharacterized protein n=1 Tax=Epargyreus clarus TaxID=520877 RepID=UPI003C2DD9FA
MSAAEERREDGALGLQRALRRTMALVVDRLNEEKERAPCLSEEESRVKMLGVRRRVALDVLMACWGLGTWLGVNGLYVQLPLLVDRLPEGWALPSSMALAVQLANVGLLVYALMKILLPRVSDPPYIYGLLAIGTLALALNAFLYTETATVGGSERSVAFLALTFFAALVGCTSSVLFYPYLRHYRDVYLTTYLVGEGLSGFIPSILVLIQGVGGEPQCVPSPDNSTLEAIYPPARFDTTAFLLMLTALSALSLISFAFVDNWAAFRSERVKPAEAAKEDEATAPRESLVRPTWIAVLVLMAWLNALMNGVLPSIQSYACKPYGTRAYHLAVALGAMANPAACLAGVWLPPLRARSLGALLAAAAAPLAFVLAAALLSPAPPLYRAAAGEALVVCSWVAVSASASYARMWVYAWARRGGAAGMRACGGATQAGSALGSLLLYLLVNHTALFTQPAACPAASYFSLLETGWIVYGSSSYTCLCPAEMVSELARRGRAAGLRVALAARPPPALPPYRDHREGMLLDLACPDYALVLDKASSSRAFNLRHSWLLIHPSAYNETMLGDTLSDAVILPDADVVFASGDALVDVYRIKPNQPFIFTKLYAGYVSSQQTLEALWASLPTAVSRRKDLHNVNIKSATVMTQPQHFRGWWDLSNRHIDTFPKLTYPLLVHCAEDLNFRLDMKQVDLYGEERNGSFDGLAGLLQRGRVELGIASMFMRADRWRVLHFCSETVVVRGSFIFRQPPRSAVSNVFALPFSRGVWAATASVFAGVATLLALAGRLAPRAAPDTQLARLTLAESFTFAIGTICQQGSDLSPRLLSVRVLMLSTLLASQFVFTSYSAKIVAILQTPSHALQTIDDLTHSPMEMGIQETTYKKVYFAESKDPATQRLYRRKLLPLGERAYLSVEDGVARLRTGLFAFQVEESSGYDIISKTFEEHEKCGLQQIPAFTLPTVAVPVRKHSGFRDLFAARLRWQREVGVVARWRRQWLAARPRCAGGGGAARVALRDAAPAARLLLAGALAAAALLLAERARPPRNTRTPPRAHRAPRAPPRHRNKQPRKLFRRLRFLK